MVRGPHWLVYGALAAACVGLLFAASAAGLVSLPAALHPFADESAETDRVNARGEASKERIRFNRALTDELVEGRIGLQEAAARVLAANGDDVNERAVLDWWFPGPTPEASAAASLIVRVHDRLKGDPPRQRHLVDRFLAEYRARYGEPDREWLRRVEPPQRTPSPSPTQPRK
jgi:hypothetical protein